MQRIRTIAAALLCLGLTCFAQPPAASPRTAGQKAAGPHRSGEARAGEIEGDQRILQALNRFTFGPRPGDVEAVRAMGLDKWFAQQLHPASLDETSLDAHLAEFPAMQLNTEELLYELPSNAVIRQALRGRITVPDSGILHTIYVNQMARVQARQLGRAGAGAKMAGGNDPAPPPIDMMAPETADDSRSAPDPGAILDLPPAQRLNALAQMAQPQLDSFFRSLRPVQRIQLGDGLTPDQAQTVGALENPERTVVEELMSERLARDIYSSAQLQEVMTDFWLNHFNIYLRKNETMPYYLASYARDSIRPHALGKFEDLLEATAHSPAMLLYLDNASSLGPDSPAAERAKLNAWRHPGRPPEGINENYGRELMELHTVGVNGGYTQADVIQAARILTGWTVDRPERGGGFQFNANRHEPGAEVVMGHQFRGSGEQQGRDLLHFLATRPATAQFICRELAVRFVSDNPPQSLVDRMVRTWMKSDGDIAAVLTAMFHSPEFWSANAYQARVKTPLEYVVSAARATNADVENFIPLANALRLMGMPLYGCVQPNGYRWDAAAWVSAGAMVDRMNFALALAWNRLPGIRVDWSALTPSAPSSPEANEAQLERLLLPGGVSATTRAAILEQFHQQRTGSMGYAVSRPVAEQLRSRPALRGPAAQQREEQYLAGLLLGSPAFQRH